MGHAVMTYGKQRRNGQRVKYGNLTYAAEREVFCGKQARRWNEPLSMIDARDILSRCGLADWATKRVPGSGGHGWCRKATKTIGLGSHAPAWLVIHEAAHAISPTRGHDATFRMCYVALVRQEMGDYWAERLTLAFKRHGLSIAISTTTEGAQS